MSTIRGGIWFMSPGNKIRHTKRNVYRGMFHLTSHFSICRTKCFTEQKKTEKNTKTKTMLTKYMYYFPIPICFISLLPTFESFEFVMMKYEINECLFALRFAKAKWWYMDKKKTTKCLCIIYMLFSGEREEQQFDKVGSNTTGTGLISLSAKGKLEMRMKWIFNHVARRSFSLVEYSTVLHSSWCPSAPAVSQFISVFITTLVIYI